MRKAKIGILLALVLAVLLAVPASAKDLETQINGKGQTNAGKQNEKAYSFTAKDGLKSFLDSRKGTFSLVMPGGERVTYNLRKVSNNWVPQSIQLANGRIIQCSALEEIGQNACEKAVEFAAKAAESAATGDLWSAGVYAAYAAYYLNECRKGNVVPIAESAQMAGLGIPKKKTGLLDHGKSIKNVRVSPNPGSV